MPDKVTPDRARLRALLHRFNDDPDRRPAIKAEIEARFTRRLAILAIDTCGFSRETRLHGIIQRLAVLERLRSRIAPIAVDHGGAVLRLEADNLFATFADPGQALRAAQAILAALARSNAALPPPDRAEVAIGLGYGDVLAIGGEDVYGDEMNLACKLGEDLAAAGEILLTPGAHSALAGLGEDFEPLDFTISGIRVDAYRAARTAEPEG